MNITGFIKAISDFASVDATELVVTVQKKICLDALIRLADRTPVDTGRARGNWQVTIGARATGTVPDSELTLHLPSRFSLGLPPRSPRPPLAFTGQQTVVEGGNFISSNVRRPCVVHLTNNVDYIIELDDGKSRQARPHQILELTFDEIVATYR